LSVIGVGTDIVAVSRIAALLARHRERFLRRCFHAGEATVAARGDVAAASGLAARWAAKEAFLKALGLPLAAVPLREIEVVSDGEHPPDLRLHGRAAVALAEAGGRRVHLSRSHERDFAIAVVLVES
jgi:holo-[acyl-carrier protein] synthase